MAHSLEMDKVVTSYPFKVRMAGFEGDTLSLAQSGWGLSMKQEIGWRHPYPVLQLAIHHDGLGLYGLSSPIELDRSFMAGPDAFRKTVGVLSAMGFYISHLSAHIQTRIIPMQQVNGSFKDAFQPIDPYPQYEAYDLSNLKFFRTYAPKLQDIILLPDQVPQAMELILKTQAEQIEEIKKREKSRKNYEDRMNQRDGHAIKPGHEVHAQIITLTG